MEERYAEKDPKKEPVFKELQAEDPDVAPTEVESMCVNCGENVSLIYDTYYRPLHSAQSRE